MNRIEKKYIINNCAEKFRLVKFLYKKGFKNIYQDRKNFSIYFDYKNYKLFHDSEEGLSFRKKIRLRTQKDLFINNFDNFNFEIKKSYPNIKKKFTFNSKKIYLSNMLTFEKNKLERQIFLKNIIPTLSTEYLRSYFFSEEFGRITIDQDLEYRIVRWKDFPKNFNFFNRIRDRRIIVEHKIDNPVNKDNLIPLIPVRFSKYCEGIKKFNLSKVF